MSVSIADVLRQSELPESETPALDKEVLLCHVLNKDRTYLFTWPEKTLDEQQLSAFYALLERRQKGEPVAYLTGVREFWSLSLKVDQSTLIPRPDTERLVEVALEVMPDSPLNVVDLGTGTGAIALALASERKHWMLTGIDQSEEAVSLAKENASLNRLERVGFKVGSWCDGIPPRSVDLVVSNPPYIASTDPHLREGDVRFEPLSALVAEQNGLSDIVDIAKQSSECLTANGWLMIEHGFEQAAEVRRIFKGYGYTDVSSYQDLSGNDRVTIGRWPGL
ncbi:peptide chain release factor N(5)-glutamine methyltransferase [Alkalimarinus coralli]|uniref:peptide chain release factor N(5)-glutamine methyltransferase n=1 Tax=Alkalimarinus coralli TaxID=2935863 RepID=UPI00202B0F18|nr:peptide chain release factor N(5)-glutamine methyltransferase [Alkalimarinus coralli]